MKRKRMYLSWEVEAERKKARAEAFEEAAKCAEDWGDIEDGPTAAKFNRKYGKHGGLSETIRALAALRAEGGEGKR